MKRNRLHSEWKEKPPKRDDDASGIGVAIVDMERAIAYMQKMSPDDLLTVYLLATDKTGGTSYIP